MRILSVDTSTTAGSIVLSDGDRLIGEMNVDSEQTHSARLLQGIQILLQSVGMTLSDLDAFAVICGPGSFTGVRIGLTTVKALADSLSKPTIPMTAFEAWIEKFPEQQGVVIPVVDARRNEVYAAAYRCSGRLLEPLAAGITEKAAIFFQSVPYPEACFIGGGATLYHRMIVTSGRPGWSVLTGDVFLARPMARLAYRKAMSGQFLPATDLQAYYLRKSDAELNWKER